MKIYHFGLVVTLSLGASQSAMALNITFDYSLDDNGFFDTEQKKQVLEAAGNFWGSRITSHLNAALSTPGGSSYDVKFGHPSKIFRGDPLQNEFTLPMKDFNVQENEYKVFVGAHEISGSTLAFASSGKEENLTINGDDDYANNVKSRGQDAFTSWGGWITFDNRTTTNWYFDDDVTTNDVPDDQSDFYSFALHELGHVLGFSSGNDSWLANVGEDPRDGTKVFTGDDAFALSAAAGDFFIELDIDENGDLTGHFAENTNGLGGGVEGQTDALMDPTIEDGTRKLPTNLDYAVLKDIGWEVSASPVPVPTAVWLFGTAILGLFGTRRRQAA